MTDTPFRDGPLLGSTATISALSGSLRLATSPVPGEVEFSSDDAIPTGNATSVSARFRAGLSDIAATHPLPVRERDCALRRRERATRGFGRRRSVRALIPALLALAAAGCRKEHPDAYGNFEAEEVVVSAELAGRLLRFDASEGERLAAGAQVALLDTATLALQREEIVAQRGASQARTTEAQAQIGILQAQLATAQREYERTLRLYRAEAATAQQVNQTGGEVRVLRERIRAAEAQIGTVREEASGTESRLAQVSEQLGKSRVVNPVAGTVLTTFVKLGEFVQGGAPLYKIADLDTLTLRAYVSGAQLASVRVGGPVQVRIDAGRDRLTTLPGRLSWVASQAEFTPTPIQTADERTDQVYAVKIRVPNRGGVLKIGMPGEVILPGGASRPRR